MGEWDTFMYELYRKMATLMTKELEKHLECGVCLERFQDPKVLRCQHSYCKRCLERLVTGDEITCPECRRKTKVPRGDVNTLQTNFLINSLLSIRGTCDCQSIVSSRPSCKKHDWEILTLFCLDCDQLICRDCKVTDHLDHKYDFIKDILPGVKEFIADIVQSSRMNLISLESSIEKIKEQEDSMHKNAMEVSHELDNFIDKQIEILEGKRQSIKVEVQKAVTAQKKCFDDQMEYFQISLGCLKSSVEFIEETLAKGSEMEVLSAKEQMIKQLTELNTAASDSTPRGRIWSLLQLTQRPIINLEELERISMITYDEEYELFKRTGLTVSKELRSRHFSKPLNEFYIRPKCKISTMDRQGDKVKVTITVPPDPDEGLDTEEFQVPVNYEPDGSFSFSFKPQHGGDYKIEVLVNERHVHGSPFTWKVDMSFIQRLFQN